MDSEAVRSVEFFHIYTDEKISAAHTATLEYLKEAKQVWDFNIQEIVLIDNYNPAQHTLRPEDVFMFLDKSGELPYFWAYEADMVSNADKLLDNITSPKIKREYIRYIEKHGKYPCSLLTATWYLTRMGFLDYSKIIRPLRGESYEPAATLINILPADYRDVESRCFELIKHSEYADALNDIQDIFIPIRSHVKTSM